MNKEQWKTITDYPDYEVSTLGNVRNQKTGKVLKPGKNGRGYWWVVLYKDNTHKSFRVHRLVCEAFLPNPENKPFVNHIDNDPRNNKLQNLSWCTRLENMQHAVKQGRIPRGEKHFKSKFTKADVQEICRLRKLGYTQQAISDRYHVTPATISNLFCRRSWKYLQFTPPQVKPQYSKGVGHPKSKLTESQVREIRHLKGKIPNGKLAAQYGVTTSAISSIHCRRTWKHIQ